MARYIQQLRRGWKWDIDPETGSPRDDWATYEDREDHRKPIEGELVLEYDNGIPRLKIGDDKNEFSALPYISIDSFKSSVTIKGGDENWAKASDDRYYQKVSVDGANITNRSKIDLQTSSEQVEIFHTKELSFVAENVIKDSLLEPGVYIYCVGQIPQDTYTIQVTVTETTESVVGDRIIGNTTTTPRPKPDWNQTDETKADYIKNKPDIAGMISGSIEETLEDFSPENGKDNVIEAKGFKVTDVKLLSEEELSEYGITPEEDVNYGYYTLAVEAPTDVVGNEYSIQISQSYYCVGNILAVNGNNVIVENIPIDDKGVVIGLDVGKDNPDTGNIINVLIITGHPELGDTLIGYFNFASGLMNNVFSRNSFVAGQENNAIGQSSAIFGYNNKTGYMALAAGRANKTLGQYSFTVGYGNTIHNGSQSAVAIGTSNEIYGMNGITFGNSNTIREKAMSAIAVGSGNHVFGPHAYVGGASNISYGKGAFSHGIGLHTLGAYTTIFGKYATINENVKNNAIEGEGTYAFVIGNGSGEDLGDGKKARSNALALDWKGNLEIAGDLIANGKKFENYDDTQIRDEFNAKIGDIEIALDHILTIQNELMGGESV